MYNDILQNMAYKILLDIDTTNNLFNSANGILWGTVCAFIGIALGAKILKSVFN